MTNKIYFNEDVNQEIETIFENNNSVHIKRLKSELNKSKPSWLALLDYGLEQIPADPINNPDNDLANYFFILSELKDIPEKISSFCLDVMLFSEEGKEALLGLNSKAEIKQYYMKNILPDLVDWSGNS